MTDAVEKVYLALFNAGLDNVNEDDARYALATLTPGSTWTTEDSVEVMVVPVEESQAMLDAGFHAYFDATDPKCRSKLASDTYRAMLSAIRKE